MTSIHTGYFGKIATAADFVAYHAKTPLSAGWQQWLLDGVSLTRDRLGSEWAARYEALPVIRFLYWNDSPNGFVVGALRRSRDESGRSFPLSVFAEVAVDAPVFHETPLAQLGLLAGLETAMGDSEVTVEALKSGLDTAAVQSGGGDPGAGIRIAAIEEAVGDGGAVGRSIVNMVELAHRVSKWDAWTPDFGLRFPLPDGPVGDAALGFWLGLCRATLGGGRGLPNLFWTKGSGNLDIYYQSPAPLAFLFLVDPTLESDHIYPVHEEEAPRVFLGAGGAGEPIATRILDPEQSVTELIDLVASVSSA